MQRQRLAEDLPDRHARIERGVGVLKDDLRLPAERAQRLGVEGEQIVAFETDAAGSGSIRRSTRRLTVDLPQPDSPTSASVSPASTWKLTPSTALTNAVGRPNKLRAPGNA